MICPKCESENVFIVDSRPYLETTRRRRRCRDCGERWTTLEISENEYRHTQDGIALFKMIMEGRFDD